MNLSENFIPLNGTVERLVIERLADLNFYRSADLIDITNDKAPRDVIKKLRRKYNYLIHTEKEGWRLDERHLSGNDKSERIARAESKYKHADNSLKLVKREKQREVRAIINRLETAEALVKEKAE